MAPIPEKSREHREPRANHRSPSRPRWPTEITALVAALILLVTTAACGPTAPPPATGTAVPSTVTSVPSASPTAAGLTSTPNNLTEHAQPTSPAPLPTPSSVVPPHSPPTAPAAIALSGLSDLANDFSAEQAYAHVKKLAAEIGPRPAGSEGESQAREYVATILRSYGYQIEEQPFTFQSVNDAGSSVSVTTPLQRSVSACAMALTSSSSVAGTLVAVDQGLASDYAGRDVTGKIVLIKRGQITFREKAANAIAAGASGVIIYNNNPGPFTGSGLDSSSAPVLAISGEDGEQLHNLVLESPVQVKLDVRTTSQPSQAYNLVAKRNSFAPKLLVGAHLDSIALGPGANDNASGVAVLLEVARLVAKTELRDEIAFVAFSGEELGLLGSRAYVQSAPRSEFGAINAMINLDMVGEGSQLTLLHRTDDSRAAGIAATARRQGLVTNTENSREDSDHAPFAHAGVSVFHLFTGIDPYYHTPSDTADKVQPETLARAARATLFVMQEISQRLN